MHVLRRITLPVASLVLALCCAHAAAQEGAGAGEPRSFPAKPVRIVVGTSASGGTDYTARLYATKLAELWKQSVVVDNRPGATGLIGFDTVAHATADGYTLLVMNVGHLITAGLSHRVNFDVRKDVQPLSLLSKTPVVLVVHPSVARTLKDFLGTARAQPGKLNYASGGTGGVQHLATELLKQEADIDLVHVPYKGSGPSVIDLVSGRVQLTLTSVPAVLAHVKAGRLNALAIAGAHRSPALPEVPTFAESGLPGVKMDLWYGLLGPSGIPSSTVKRIGASVAEAAASKDLAERMSAGGVDVVGNSPEEFAPFYRAELARWLKVAAKANIQVD